ncbi:hypothetical protein SDC9_78099 [bioreactor metagenome]|uniref:Uncharacterized protein n=1 Tax=bioreactor metagenome TaxID=1076179 RepID=A0A644Z017_9ZZZZ
MLHHQQGIAQVPQALEGGEQLVVVPLVQANGGLVQNIQHPHQRGADLGRQTDALALAAGERPGGAGKGQISKAYGLQKSQAAFNLPENPVGNQHLLLRQLQLAHPVQLVYHGHFCKVVDA